jgi:molybdate transport system substrate-binding protein
MTGTSLRMISSMATRDLLSALATQYQREAGQSVLAESAGGVDVAKRVSGGEVFDVVVLAANAIDKLIAEGRIFADSRADLVESGVAVAVRASASPASIATEADVKALVQSAPTLSYSTGPSGVYLEKLFARWGILEEIRPRIVVPPPGVPVGSLVADGRVALGFQQLSELMSLPGINVLGLLPDEIQSMTVFTGGVCAGSAAPAAARALLRYLASPGVAAVKQAHGMAAR